ncbi:MAG: IS200/IS605 family transposase, partial [Acidobacteriaceae bacterium]|nr:IS200/IS605 family transposase [Acidobacteriaceae bacterium]
YRRGAHSGCEIHLHLVWTTKSRKPVLTGEAALRLREVIQEICGQHAVKIMNGPLSKDHVHLFVSIPPRVTSGRLVQGLKGKTANRMRAEFVHLRKGILGTAPVGTRLLLLPFGPCDRRSHRRIQGQPEHGGDGRFPSRRLRPSTLGRCAWQACGQARAGTGFPARYRKPSP